MSDLVFYLGILICAIAGISLLVAAFRTSLLWGLAVLFIPPVSIFYLLLHWQDASGSFKMFLFGLMILIGFAYMNDDAVIATSEPIIPSETYSVPASSSFPINNASTQQFRCDGRTHCSQMTSCAEATYFLRNCPNTKMDGNNDGIPCERQWCR